MPNVNVTYDEMRQAGDNLRSGQDNLTGELDRLRNLIDQLVSSGFVTDAASGQFQETYQKFTDGSKQTISALEGLSTFLYNAASAMQETDAQLARSIGS
jgi:WXG100 family type VII secretion target